MRDLVMEAQERQEKLDADIKSMRSYGLKRAQSDRAYVVALAQEMLRLRAENLPATLIRDLARGNQEIAKLRFERDASDALYETARESVMNHKQRLKTINETMQREWGNVK